VRSWSDFPWFFENLATKRDLMSFRRRKTGISVVVRGVDRAVKNLKQRANSLQGVSVRPMSNWETRKKN